MYRGSFLYTDNLVYVENESATDFNLNVYDPDKGFLLLKVFVIFVHHTITEKNLEHFLKIPAVRGYRFEEFILSDLQCFCISTISQGSKDELVLKHEFDFKIHGGCKHMDEPHSKNCLNFQACPIWGYMQCPSTEIESVQICEFPSGFAIQKLR